MRPLLFFALAVLFAAVQAALLRWLGGGAYPVALPLTIVVYLGLHSANVEGAVGAAAVGYLVDLMAGGPKGLMTFLAVALFLFSRVAGSAIDVQGRVGFAVLTATGTLLYGAAALGFITLVTPAESAPTFSLLGRAGLEAVLTGLAGALVLGGLRRVDRLFTREDPTLLS